MAYADWGCNNYPYKTIYLLFRTIIYPAIWVVPIQLFVRGHFRIRIGRGEHMQVSTIQSYLVPPGKGEDNPPAVMGTKIPRAGRLFEMLSRVFDVSDEDCDIPIRFLMADDGSQQNEVRSMLIEFTKKPDQAHGMPIAERLRDFTTGRSKLGLLFLILGVDDGNNKLVVSRFPAERGILADADETGLTVEFVERIFMKSANLYKAALFTGTAPESHFWSGFAVDKQINAPDYEIAHYWIKQFLNSDYKTTSKAGSKRVALALREASKTASDLSVKRELAGVGMLIGGFAGTTVTLQQMMDSFGLSQAARDEITKHLAYPELASASFILDTDEFHRHAAYASVELDNGSLLIAPSDRFEECFDRQVLNEQQHEYRFTTEGRIVDELVRGRR
jgi:hypothetical protein